MRTLFLLLLIVAMLCPAVASATDVQGDVWGTWTRENSPYNVIGEVRVPPGSTLVIEPGVLVDFQGHYKFIVDSLATLLAVGTETDSIFFTCDTLANPDRWHGIRFISADSNSQVSYCQLEHGRATGDGADGYGGAIYCSNTSLTISHNLISHSYATVGAGVYCDNLSSPRITHNIVEENLAAHSGGGISCWYCGPTTISHNTISNNSAGEYDQGGMHHGGGISCWDCGPTTINDNTISDNRAGESFQSCGGGISSGGCVAILINNNIISGNVASSGGEYYSWAWGGGIVCSGATISNNVITGNAAWAYAYDIGEAYGGGMFCSSSTVRNNIISGNGASGQSGHYQYGWAAGGGIRCSNTTIINSTITGNGVGLYGCGGGISCDSSSTIVNTILWADDAAWDPEIDGDPTVTYSDVQGGWPEVGNIDCDPLFRDPANGDFQITWENYPDPDSTKSCCIDAGDPNSPKDPDNTIADIGAFYFHQYLNAEMDCECLTPILCRGKNLYFKVIVTNNAQVPISGTLIFRAYAYFHCDPQNILITIPRFRTYDPGQTTAYYFFKVPNLVGPGEYSSSVEGNLSGFYLFCCMNTTIVQCEPWKTVNDAGWQLVEVGSEEVFLPTVVSLEQNYPNPFNVTTNINYQLPVDSRVKLEVYNVLGEKVATLVEERQEAGYRSVIWDASELSSGLYFYKLTAGDFTETKRMMLVK